MLNAVRRCFSLRCVLPAGAVWAYCLIFPEDLTTLLSPLTAFLQLSNVISPGLYGLAAVIVTLWFVERNWGRAAKK